MKALSLWQPWATLMAINAKRIETRSWSTAYRGPLAIVSTKRFPVEARKLFWEPPFHQDLTAAGYDHWEKLPCGFIVAVVDLKDIYPTRTSLGELNVKPVLTTPFELDYGDYTTGRFAWLTANCRRLAKAISVSGGQGLWEIPPQIEQMITDQLKGAA